MASTTSLRPVARRIAETVKDYASSQGLPWDQYALVGSWDEKTGRISLVVGTDTQIDERLWYQGILQSLRGAFSDQPWIVMNIGLVVERVPKLDDVYLHFTLNDDDIDLTDLLERSQAGGG